MSKHHQREIGAQTQAHIERFQSGHEAWNAWAKKLLLKKAKLQDAGKWRVKHGTDELGRSRLMSADASLPAIQRWLDEAYVDFSCLHFQGETGGRETSGDKALERNDEDTLDDRNLAAPLPFSAPAIHFNRFVFPSEVSFRSAQFKGLTSFQNAVFHEEVDFFRAQFRGESVFENARFGGETYFNSAQFQGIAGFGGVQFARGVDFSRVRFKGHADFLEADFQGETVFAGTQFKEKASFLWARFQDTSYFTGAKFQFAADFGDAAFLDIVDFEEARFLSDAAFNGGRFKGEAVFRLVDFLGRAHFAHTRFSGPADFEAMHSKRSFDLDGAVFVHEVPNFNQAHFSEAPRLDQIAVRPRPSGVLFSKELFPELRRFLKGRKKAKVAPAPQSPAAWPWLDTVRHWDGWDRLSDIWQRWHLRAFLFFAWVKLHLAHSTATFANRHSLKNAESNERNHHHEAYFRALKRLAAQAHDHRNEMDFFAGELRARRFVHDFPLQKGLSSMAGFWSGVFYELFANFGRSLLRPLCWWGLAYVVFAGLYWGAARPEATQLCLASSPLSAPAAVTTLAAHNALPFFNFDQAETVKRAQSCLYGAAPLYPPHLVAQQGSVEGALNQRVHSNNTRSPMAPLVPGWVTFFGVLHTLFSLGFLFLLLLVLRNQFKMR